MGIPACARWGAQAASLQGSAACRDRPSSRYLKNYMCKDVAGRAARNYRLAACAPPEIRETRALPNHYNAGGKLFFANNQSIPRLKSASAVPSIGSL